MSREGTGSQVLHIRENSASEMEALFKVVDPHASEANKSIPFRDRNLPASFFQQPGLVPNGLEAPGYVDGPITHLRAHSSPASLQQTLSAAPQTSPPQHIRQHSCELVDEPLPPGWGMARTAQGQRYFLNHVLQTTTWQDPRKSHTSSNNLGSPQQPGSPSSGTQTPPSHPGMDVTKVPLPQGWECAFTPEGEIYFINHIDRSTSWFHPSVPQVQQRLGMRLPHQLPAGSSQTQLRNSVSSANSPPISSSAVQRTMSADQQRQLKLQQLQMEKERLKKRQEELARQEMLIRGIPAQEVGDLATELTTVADPFLGQQGSTDLHSRQESADSGLGGMGTGYNNLPPTPEDFLTNMEDMDIGDGGHKMPGQGDFGSMDIANVGDVSETHNMDSEELVPSLQEDIGSELLKDVENVLNSKGDNLLTWL